MYAVMRGRGRSQRAPEGTVSKIHGRRRRPIAKDCHSCHRSVAQGAEDDELGGTLDYFVECGKAVALRWKRH